MPINICPECGDRVEQRESGSERWRRFCSDQCRESYHHKKLLEQRRSRARPKQLCPNCGKDFQVEETCEWCGEKFTDASGQERRYCSRSCAAAARSTAKKQRRGSRRLGTEEEPERWREKLTEAARSSRAGKRGKRVRLVCGTTSMYTGLDGLLAIIRYHLKLDPYDGSIYVFRDSGGSMLKYIEWDGQSFLQGKRRAQSGTYPWPGGQAGHAVEISEKEFAYLLSKSIVPFKEKKCCDN